MANVNVTVESAIENPVVEVSYDGQETVVQPPLTEAEFLTKQALKIDFEHLSDDDDDMDGEDEAEDDEVGEDGATNTTKSAQESKALTQQWPWESVRNKLRDALTEMSVLSDVIAFSTKECGKDLQGNPKRYMVLDGPVEHKPPDSKLYTSLVAKRKSLDVPAKILLDGAEHLKQLQQSENLKNNRNAPPDFHTELLKLRQNWRLKKVSNTILGDLSYRTAGSMYKQSGVFEVVKAVDDLPGNAPPSSDEKLPKSTLRVNVPSELVGIAYIQVTIQKESEQLMTTNMSNFGSFGVNPPDLHWQKKLEAAQNVLFCKELFAQLAKEAIQLQAPIPHMVVGNQITASLFADIQLIISLCHSTGSERKSSSSATSAPPAQSQRDHSHVLEHSLHQLLRLQHSRNINPDHTALSSAPVGIPKRRRLAGPRATDRQSLVEMATQPTLLEKIIQQAQHVVLRLRTMFVLDTMARELKDPLITCHWGTMSSPTRTSVKVNIVTAGYDTIQRTQLVIHVAEKKLTVVCKDKGQVMHFSHEPQELRDFILCQVSQHQVNRYSIYN